MPKSLLTRNNFFRKVEIHLSMDGDFVEKLFTLWLGEKLSIPSCKQPSFQGKKCRLILEDGAVFEGTSFGADKEAFGEVVFNTSMCGYQEILTDPSYKGQMVIMTYPLIGNYGIHSSYSESPRIHAAAIIVKEYCHYPSHFLSEQSLHGFLKEQGVMGLQGIDTRALTRKIRSGGELRALITTSEEPVQHLVEKVRASPKLM